METGKQGESHAKISQGLPKLPANHQKLGEGLETDRPFQPQKEPTLLWSLDVGLRPPDRGDRVCGLNLSLWCFARAGLTN